MPVTEGPKDQSKKAAEKTPGKGAGWVPKKVPKTAEKSPKRAQNCCLTCFQVGMNGDTFSIKTPKECSKKSAASFKGKFLTRGNVLRTLFLQLFLEDLGVILFFSGKEKHVNINKFAGLSRDWARGKILFLCFFEGHSLWGTKNS